MSLRYIYANSDAVGDSTDITANCRLYKADLTANAEEGSVATSTLVVDDPDGTLDIVGFKNILITETVATGSNTVVGSFYVADRTISRGPYKTGTGRIWTVNLVDVNTIADWRVHVGSGNSRPAETDIARLNWLMGTSELAQVSNTTLLETSGPVAMDAVDYNGQKSSQVMDDAAQQSGKNYFIYYREATSSPALFYDFSGSTAYTSSVRLTNVNSDIEGDATGLTFAISEDTKLVRSPSRVFSGALVNYDGGAVYEQLASTYNTFRRRDAVVPADNVKTSAKATTRAIRYLTEMSTEEDIITTSFRVPAAKVRFLREGMRCQIKVSHFPGYTAFVWGRVLMWNVKQDSEEEYLITVDLSVEPGVESQSCVGGAYALTPSQHFYPLGSGTSDADGYVYYRAPDAPLAAPQPFFVGGMGFPIYNGPGGPDYTGDCLGVGVHFVMVGAGTLTIQTTALTSVKTLVAITTHWTGGIQSTEATSAGFAPGGSVVVTLPADSSDNCVHTVRIVETTGACGGKWGYAGADWVLA